MSISKAQKAIAEASGRLKQLRGNIISNKISEKSDISVQISVAMNALEAIFTRIEQNGGADIRPADYKEYQALRAAAKEEADKEIEIV